MGTVEQTSATRTFLPLNFFADVFPTTSLGWVKSTETQVRFCQFDYVLWISTRLIAALAVDANQLAMSFIAVVRASWPASIALSVSIVPSF